MSSGVLNSSRREEGKKPEVPVEKKSSTLYLSLENIEMKAGRKTRKGASSRSAAGAAISCVLEQKSALKSSLVFFSPTLGLSLRAQKGTALGIEQQKGIQHEVTPRQSDII